MGKGSKLANNRRMYNFSLVEDDPDDVELIKYLEERSTTHCARDGIRMLMKNESHFSSDNSIQTLIESNASLVQANIQKDEQIRMLENQLNNQGSTSTVTVKKKKATKPATPEVSEEKIQDIENKFDAGQF